MSRLTNYIITHKAFEVPSLSSYLPLQVGFGNDLGYQRDSIGDSIAQKNKNWCELTGLYWIWKNDTSSEYIGISHYRRYFKGKNGILQENEALDLLQNADVLAAEFEPYKETVYEQYCIESGFEKDLLLCREAIEKLSPKYLDAFDKVMKQGGISQYNMMICSKNIFDDYCSWLFPVLEYVEARTDLSEYNDYQKRIFGFLSERLLNVWLAGSRLQVKELPVLQTEMSHKEEMRLKLRRLKNRWIFQHKYRNQTETSH